MRLYEILYEGASPEDLLKMPLVYGNTKVDATKYIVPEEQPLYSPEAMEAMKHVPVFFMHAVVLRNNKDQQDLIKLRGDYSADTHGEYVRAMVDRGVNRMVRRRGSRIDIDRAEQIKQGQADPLPKEAMARALPRGATKKRAWETMQDLMHSNAKKTVIPMPSSSPLVRMIADSIVSNIPNAEISDVLYKDDPMFSDMAASAARPNHVPGSLSTTAVGNVKRRVKELEAALERKYDAAVDDELNRSREWLSKQKPFSIKNHYTNPRSNYGKWLYGWMRARELSKGVPHDIILVDDNIVGGTTIANAVKGLMSVNPNIRSIRVLVLHKYE